MGADDAYHRSARLAADRKAAREHVDVAAVLVPQAELRFVGRLAARDAVVRLVGARPIVRVHQTLPRADVRFDFVLRVAEHLLPARRVHDRVGVDVPVPDTFPGAGKRQREPLLALAQRLFGSFPFGDVEVRADDAHDRSARFSTDRKAAREHVNEVTVLVAKTELAFVGLRALRQGLVQLARPGLVIRMQQAFPGAHVRFDFALGVAEHLRPARRVHDGAAFEVPVPHALAGAGKRQGEPFFILAEHGLGPLALRDVAHDHLNRFARHVVEPCGVDLHFGHDSIQPHDALFRRRHRLTGHHPADAFAHERVAGGMKHIERRLAQNLLRRRRAEQTHRGGVQEHQAIVLADQDAVRR